MVVSSQYGTAVNPMKVDWLALTLGYDSELSPECSFFSGTNPGTVVLVLSFFTGTWASPTHHGDDLFPSLVSGVERIYDE